MGRYGAEEQKCFAPLERVGENRRVEPRERLFPLYSLFKYLEKKNENF